MKHTKRHKLFGMLGAVAIMAGATYFVIKGATYVFGALDKDSDEHHQALISSGELRDLGWLPAVGFKGSPVDVGIPLTEITCQRAGEAPRYALFPSGWFTRQLNRSSYSLRSGEKGARWHDFYEGRVDCEAHVFVRPLADGQEFAYATDLRPTPK